MSSTTAQNTGYDNFTMTKIGTKQQFIYNRQGPTPPPHFPIDDLSLNSGRRGLIGMIRGGWKSRSRMRRTTSSGYSARLGRVGSSVSRAG